MSGRLPLDPDSGDDVDARHDPARHRRVTGHQGFERHREVAEHVVPADHGGPARWEQASGRPGRRPPVRLDLRVVLAVAAGGAVGGPARHGVDLLLPSGSWLPWSTLTVNVLGACLLGWLVARLAGPRRPADPGPGRYLRPFAAVGAVGSFTTFSTLALQLQQLLSAGSTGRAALYLGLSLAAGLLATWLGLLVGRRPRKPGPLVAL